MVARDVMRSKGFIFKSPTAITSDVIGADKMGGLKFTSLEDEYSDKKMEQLDKAIEPHRGLQNLDKSLGAVDVTIGGTVERSGNTIRVEPIVVDMMNPDHETYSVIVKCGESRLKDETLKAVRSLLNKILQGEKIYADRLTDKKWSKVIYVMTTIDKRQVEIEMDFTGDRPNPALQDVRIMPPEDIDKNGTTTLKVRSQEGRTIDFVFDYKLGKLYSVRVDTPIPDPSNDTEQRETLTIRSDAGYLLTIKSLWKDGAVQSVQIAPKVNPFGGREK